MGPEHEQLVELVLSVWSSADIRAVAKRYGLATSLPGPSVSTTELANEFVDLLRRRGHIQDELFDRLIQDGADFDVAAPLARAWGASILRPPPLRLAKPPAPRRRLPLILAGGALLAMVGLVFQPRGCDRSAQEHYEMAIALGVSGDVRGAMAEIECSLGKTRAAEATLPPTSIAFIKATYGELLWMNGSPDNAVEFLAAAADWATGTFASNKVLVGYLRSYLAQALLAQGEMQAAIREQEYVVGIYEHCLPPCDPVVTSAYDLLGTFHYRTLAYDKAWEWQAKAASCLTEDDEDTAGLRLRICANLNALLVEGTGQEVPRSCAGVTWERVASLGASVLNARVSRDAIVRRARCPDLPPWPMGRDHSDFFQ